MVPTCTPAFGPGVNVEISLRKLEKGVDSKLLDSLQELRQGPWKLDPDIVARTFEVPKLESESRSQEWAESRRCLADVLQRLTLSWAGAPSSLGLSLSHTKSACIAAAAVLQTPYVGIGVDMESVARELSPRLVKRVMAPDELSQGWSPIQIWTVKEACFKATPPAEQKFVGNYRILSGDPGAQLASGEAIHLSSEGVPLPGLAFRFQIFQAEDHWIALALSVDLKKSQKT